MLSLKALFSSYNSRLRSYAELLPWFRQITPGIVLNLDGSLIAAFTYEPIDLESSSPEDADAGLRSMDMGWKSFDDRNVVWTFLDKRRRRYMGNSEIANPVARYVDQSWRSCHDDGNLGTVRHSIAVSYQPFGGSSGFLDEVGARVVEHEEQFPKALMTIAIQRMTRKSQLERIEGPLISAIEQFEKQLANFQNTLTAKFGVTRLIRGELLTELANRANVASPRKSVSLPSNDLYFLNTFLPTDTIRRESGGFLQFDSSAGPKSVTMHTVKGYPGVANNKVVESLLEVRGDFTLVNMFRVLDSQRAAKFIQDQEAHYRANVKSPLVQAVEKLTGVQSERVNMGMAALAEDAQEALVEATRDGVGFGYHCMAVQVIASTKEENAQTAQQVYSVLSNAGYGLVKENVNLMGAFAATIPGASDSVLRTSIISTSNFADLTVVRGQSSGENKNPYLTEQRATPSEALALLPTQTDIPEMFNLHVGDVGHFMIVGPAGAGKTTFVNFLIHMWQRYEPCQVIVVDRNFSNYITIKSLGGSYVNLKPGTDGARMNPARWLAEKADHPKLRTWLEMALRAINTTPLTPQDIMRLDKAIALAACQSGENTLSKIHAIVKGQSQDLAARLHAWTRHSDRYGEFFDNPVDTFSLGNITGVEVGGLLNDEHLAPAMLAYLFQVVEEKVDRADCPILIYLEEAWYLLRNPAFRSMFEDWIKTMRKRGAVVGIATQSLKDIRDCPIGPTLNDNIKTRIYLPNAQAFDSLDVYRDSCGLQLHDVERIRDAQQKQDYYIVQDSRRRMVNCQFSPEIVSLTRSDARAKKVFAREMQKGGDWLARYMKEMVDA